MPVTPWVGYKPKQWVQSKQWLGYTSIWNFLNYAAMTIPVGAADPVLDRPDQGWLSHTPRNDADAFNKAQCMFLFFIILSFLFLSLPLSLSPSLPLSLSPSLSCISLL